MDEYDSDMPEADFELDDDPDADMPLDCFTLTDHTPGYGLSPSRLRLVQEFIDFGPGWWDGWRWRMAAAHSESIRSPMLN